MADRWFEIASLDHFWIRRRFQVFQRLAGQFVSQARAMAEIGCGHGLLQRQVEDTYGREVSGFDLNDFALRQNVSRASRLFCYDIFQAEASLCQRFDLIFLFDVLEHIADEDRFLRALLFHLHPSGRLVINVPAAQWLYSAYDRAAGHVRRYSMKSLCAAAARNGLEMTAATTWGLPLVPSLILRKLWLIGKRDEAKIITAGFDMRGPAINSMMEFVSRCEWIPQRLLGTSLLAVFSLAQTGSTRAPEVP